MSKWTTKCCLQLDSNANHNSCHVLRHVFLARARTERFPVPWRSVVVETWKYPRTAGGGR